MQGIVEVQWVTEILLRKFDIYIYALIISAFILTKIYLGPARASKFSMKFYEAFFGYQVKGNVFSVWRQ